MVFAKSSLTEMSPEEKITFFKESALWNYLLLDKEIRYSDFITFFMEKYQYDPFNEKNLAETLGAINGKFEVSREKQKIDIWIDKVENFEVDEEEHREKFITVLTPYIIIENKLKSLPYEKQLQNYTETILKEYYNSQKTKLKLDCKIKRITWEKFKKKIKEKNINPKNDIGFYLFTPNSVKSSNIEITIKKDIIKEDFFEEDKEFNWAHSSYKEIGERILKKIPQKENRDHFDHLMEEFANVLININVFYDELNKFEIDEEILNVFDPGKNEIFNEFPKMHDLFHKYRASQCAKYLNEKLNENEEHSIIGNWSWEEFKKLKEEGKYTYIISHSFSNKTGIFEIARMINDNIIYSIQYQDKVLKKALVLENDDNENYTEFFKNPWEGTENGQQRKFVFKNGQLDGKCLKYKFDDKRTFYYTKHTVREEDTVIDIINLMVQHIMDDPHPNSTPKTIKK